MAVECGGVGYGGAEHKGIRGDCDGGGDGVLALVAKLLNFYPLIRVECTLHTN